MSDAFRQIDESIARYQACIEAGGHVWRPFWRRYYGGRLPLWIPRWRRSERCDNCRFVRWGHRPTRKRTR